MSMMAKFIALEEADLAAVRANPDLAEELFTSLGRRGTAGAALRPDVRERLRVLVPQLMAESLAKLDPAMRARVEAQLAAFTNASSAEAMESAIGQMLRGGKGRGEAASKTAISPRAELSLDKAWHGVHYLLCGKCEEAPGPLAQAVMGGAAIGDDEDGFSGYGPARAFTPPDVDVISAALSAPAVESMAAARFNADRMENLGVYPGWEDGDADWVMDALRNLRTFYADASRNRQAVVTCIV